MRQMIAGLIAGVVFAATMATAPAQACAVVDPCGYGYYGYGHRGYAGYGYGYGVRERLPDPQYYWVNQGPTYTGPGNYAPRPVYRERTVIGSRYYGRPYRYGYRHAYHYRGHYHAHRYYGHRVKPLRYKY
jgi:opacity protein-like surface antigen